MITNIETGQQLRKVVTKIAMGEQVSDDGRGTNHERFRAERVEGSKIGAGCCISREYRRRLRPLGGLTQELTPMRCRGTLERELDTERSKRTTPWVRLACQRLLGENTSSVHSGGCPRRKALLPEWTATQSEGIPVHKESTREFFHSAKRRHTSNDVTCRRQITQSCVHAEPMRCTVGNLFAVESRCRASETCSSTRSAGDCSRTSLQRIVSQQVVLPRVDPHYSVSVLIVASTLHCPKNVDS